MAVAAGTALIAGVMTIAMGCHELSVRAGRRLGLNAAVAFGLTGLGMTPAQAMGVVVIEGVVITILVLAGLREAIMDAIPLALKRAIGVGIGLFILFIGFWDGGLSPASAAPQDPVDFIFPNTPAPGSS